MRLAAFHESRGYWLHDWILGASMMQVIFMQAYRWLIMRALRRVRARDWGAEEAEVQLREKET